jgi:hypothetical protein
MKIANLDDFAALAPFFLIIKEGLVVRRGASDAIERGASAADLGDEVVGGLGQHERLGFVVPV